MHALWFTGKKLPHNLTYFAFFRDFAKFRQNGSFKTAKFCKKLEILQKMYKFINFLQCKLDSLLMSITQQSNIQRMLKFIQKMIKKNLL